MKIMSFLLAACMALWLAGPLLPVVLAQDQPVGEASGVDEPAAKSSDTQPAEPTRTDRLLNLVRVLEKDRLKLAELDQELEQAKRFVELLGKEALKIAGRLDESRARLAGLDPETDADEIAMVRDQISTLETELALFKTQGELALTADAALREQKTAMALTIELENRARALLRGATPAEPGQPAAGVSPAPEQAAPAGSPISPLIMPGLPTGPAPAAPAAIEERLETTEQISARREVERRQIQLRAAEQAIVAFVERRQAMETLILLEDRLLRTARGSKENLEKALRWRRKELEQKNAANAPLQEIRDLEESRQRISALIGEVTEEIDRRTTYLAGLNERMKLAGPEESRVMREVEGKRKEVREARRTLNWLQSPLHPKNLLEWARTRGPRMLLVLLVAGALLLLLRLTVRRVARLLVRRGRGEQARGANRADTLAFSFRSAFSVVVMVGGMLLVLQEAGLDVQTVLGGAAILGIAIAFGAQNLMRDYFTGFLILLEDQYELGDLISIGDITGTVESVNMRITVLRDLEGRVHFIPNGQITGVTNRTYGWGRAVLEVPIGFDQDVDRAMEVLQGVSKELKADPEFGGWIEEDPVMLGVDKFTDYGVVIKFMLKTRPDKVFPVRRELLRRIKKTFDKVGIRISVPHLVVTQQKPEE